MNAGLPGSGIGGVFYLVSAFFMPFLELVRTFRGESSVERWIGVLKQLAMAVAIMTGMWFMGLFLGFVMEFFYAGEADKLNHLIQISHSGDVGRINVFHLAPIFMSLLTLSIIVGITHMLRFMVRPAGSK